MKIKGKMKDKQLQVRIRLDKGMDISGRELTLLQKGNTGLLICRQLRPNLLEYIGPQGIPMLQYLKQPMKQEDFFYLMKQIVDITYYVENHQLFIKNLLLDLRYTYINPTTKELKCVYLPVMSEFRRADVIGFMEAIIYQGNYSEEDSNYLVHYVLFLRQMGEYSIEKLQNYLSEVCEKNQNDIKSTVQMPEAGTSVLIAEKPFPDDEGGTTVLTSVDNIDNMEPPMGCMEVHFPFLIRLSNDEKILIDKDVFVMGKAKSNVDYSVLNNAAVSRIHADIITKGTHYFVVDHNSTNKTYIDEAVLTAGKEMELMDGSILRLANEEFEFHI